jgi:predicted transcriptional regulator
MKKSAVISTLNEFPKEFALEDFLERLIVIEKIDEGLKDIKEGKTISHESVKKMVTRWRK